MIFKRFLVTLSSQAGIGHVLALAGVAVVLAASGFAVYQYDSHKVPASSAENVMPIWHEGSNYKVVDTITGPNIPPTNNGGAWCNDIAYFDGYNGKLYLSDWNNQQVDVVDTRDNKLLAPFGAGTFTGIGGCNNFDYEHSGPSGIVADDHGQLWVGNGDSTDHVFNADTGRLVATVNTGGALRADEQTFDARDNIIVVTNPGETTPFYSLINASTHKVLGKYTVPDATALEQPTWDTEDGLVYMSIPSTNASPNGGEVAVINPRNLANPYVKALTIGSDCGPSGIAIDEGRQLAALGCAGPAELLNLRSGAIVATIPQVIDTDEVWFNPTESRYYYGSYTYAPHQSMLGVISSQTRQLVANVPLGMNGFHSMAADSYTNEVYMPIDGKGIVVYKAY